MYIKPAVLFFTQQFTMLAVKVCILACFCSTGFAKSLNLQEINLDDIWKNFKQLHGKNYSHREELHRLSVFTENVKKIVSHNVMADMKVYSYHLGINAFTDLTPQEFASLYTGLLKPSSLRTSGKFFVANADDLPKEVDWRTKGLVTAVKDQGGCGSCWAFSAVASLEGQHAKATGHLVSLSEQNLVDCSRYYGNLGCRGGSMDAAFYYILDNGGIDTEESYPYEGIDKDCRLNASTIGATLQGFVNVRRNEKSLQAAVAQVGPISVGIDASNDDFHLYSHGVYNPPACASRFWELDHGVAVVGYATDKDSGLDYWLIKNSWGTSWGLEGYLKLVRNKNNRCGVASLASYPIV